ncbi:MAG: hypothetical protein ACLVJH_18265 [Faecalibacterium prausnitzii]
MHTSDDTAAQLVNAVLTNTQMWDQDLTKIEGLEAAVLADLELIRTEDAPSCLQRAAVAGISYLHKGAAALGGGLLVTLNCH